MCGICGILHFDPNQLVDAEKLTAMSKTLIHRGPDDFGTYIAGPVGLAHRRLSILDLSAAGHQPMSSTDGRFWIVFNGEIYNYVELKRYLIAKGHSFYSRSDTEVLLNLFIEEGKECLNKLNGMFAFAIWDSVEKKLFVARDRLGIKPLYWYRDENTFLFASEIKAFFRFPNLKAAVNVDGLQDYLSFQFCLGEKTMFENIYKVSPGWWMEIAQNGQLQTACYWDLNFQVDTTHSEEYFKQTLSDLLQDSISLRLRSDVPLGSHLSGGLDSSVVASLAANNLQQPIHTFSGGFKEGSLFDETRYARIVAEHNHTMHHETFPSAQDFVELLPSIIYHMDEPAAGPGIFPQLMVAKMASEHVKVVLGGQGGDELFAGYARYLIAYLEECIRGGIESTQEDPSYIVNFQTILPNLPQLQGYQSLMRHFWKDGLFGSQEERYFRLIDRGDSIRSFFNTDFIQQSHYSSYEEYRRIFTTNAPASYINRMTRFDIKTLLPALLHVEDRTSMMVSIESRVPLLDYRIVELSAAIPPRFKYGGGQSKHILREASSAFVPKEILERQDKMGFPVPLDIWYRKDPVRSFVRETLLSSAATRRGWFDINAIKGILDQELPFGRTIWGLLCMELWAKSFLD